MEIKICTLKMIPTIFLFFLPKVDSWAIFGFEAKWNTRNPCHNYVHSVDMTSPHPRKFV